MDRQLQKLRRDELLEILLEVEQENEQLTKQNLELRDQLANREISINRAGSLADASIQLSGVLLAAQDAADMYVQNVKALCVEYARKIEGLCRDRSAETNDRNLGSLVNEVTHMFDEFAIGAMPATASSVKSNDASES
ncbi:MAG: hypothetical protein Q4A07_09670 [Coriobacteriales bacterium]|nr:hypothetical protein [Coriobacteriales bacterium]